MCTLKLNSQPKNVIRPLKVRSKEELPLLPPPPPPPPNIWKQTNGRKNLTCTVYSVHVRFFLPCSVHIQCTYLKLLAAMAKWDNMMVHNTNIAEAVISTLYIYTVRCMNTPFVLYIFCFMYVCCVTSFASLFLCVVFSELHPLF